MQFRSRLASYNVNFIPRTMGVRAFTGPQKWGTLSVDSSPLVLRQCSAPGKSAVFKPQKRRRVDVLAQASNGSSPKSSSPETGDALGDRILSGEFTDEGSTKERLTRPVRKFLAKDPIGPGTST